MWSIKSGKACGVIITAAFAWFSGLASAEAQGGVCEPQRASEKFPTYANRTVKIGVNSTYPPFSYNDPKDMNKIVGIDVEIVEAALKCAGLRYEFINGQHSGLYPALFSGSIDVMIGNIFFRPDRAERAGYIIFMTTSQSLVVGKSNPKNIRAESGMCGLTASGSYNSSSSILVQDISKKCIESGKLGITWIPAADHDPAYRSLANGRIDMVMDGTISALMRMRSMDGQNYSIAFSVPTNVKAGFIVTKGNNEVLNAIGQGLKELQRSSNLIEIMKRYEVPSELLLPVEVIP